ncbi:MAG: hypothetical protein ACR2LE_07775 [Nocardioidaceae bacterium]
MARPKKRPAIPATPAGIADFAFEKAKEVAVLKDENIQKMLLEAGNAIAANLQDWYQEWHARTKRPRAPKDLGQYFGQRKLRRRVENLTTSVGALSSGRPELAEALTPVTAAIAQLRLSVEIAGRLPIVKRKQAHFRIDDELDQLEQKLFEATFPAG